PSGSVSSCAGRCSRYRPERCSGSSSPSWPSPRGGAACGTRWSRLDCSPADRSRGRPGFARRARRGTCSAALRHTIRSSRAPRAGAPNLVLVTVDTLRADHLEPYGYDRATAPTLSALARDGVTFDLAIAQAPETLHSMAALMTGLYPDVLDHAFEQRERRGP